MEQVGSIKMNQPVEELREQLESELKKMKRKLDDTANMLNDQ